MANKFLIKRGDGAPAAGTIDEYELVYDYTNNQLYTKVGSTITAIGSGDIEGVTAGTGLSGGGTSGTVTLNIDSTVATLTGSQTLSNKTLASPTFTGDILFNDVSTPVFTVKDTTNNVQADWRATDNLSAIGTTTDNAFYLKQNGSFQVTINSNQIILNTQGEDRNTIIKDSSGTAAFKVDAGTSTTEIETLNVAGVTTLQSHLELGDSDVIKIGAASDLQLFHNGTNSFVSNYGGALFIENNVSDSDIYFRVNDGGSIVTALRIDASEVGRIILPNDNQALYFGTAGDLRIQHNGTDSLIRNHAGALKIEDYSGDGDFYLTQYADNRDIILQTDDGSGGVTPYLTLDGSASLNILHQDTRINDSKYFYLGTDSDFSLLHNNSNAYIENRTGHLYIRNYADDSDIVLESDDGSGGVTEYFKLDGSITKTSVSKDFKFLDSVMLQLGIGEDFRLYHDGSNNYIDSITSDQDLYIRVNDGGTIKNAIHIDASENALVKTHGNLTVGGQVNIQDTNAIIFRNSGQMELITYGGYNIDLNPAGDVRIDGASLVFKNNAEYIYMEDSAGTSTRMLGMNSSNITYIGPIDNYAGGEIYYGANSNVGNHRWWVGGTERMRITPSNITILAQNQDEGGEIALSPGTDPSYTTTFYLDSRQNKFRIHSSGSERFTIATDGTLTLNGTVTGSAIKDQDDMSSNSASHLATQQSIKAYVDANAGTTNASDLTSGTIPSARIHRPESGDWFDGTPVVGSDGVMEVGRYIDFHNTDTTTNDYDVRLDCSFDNQLDIQTGLGYIRLGPQNVHWSHIYTDRQGHLLDKNVTALDGKFQSYSGVDLNLRRSQGDTDRLLIQSGISTLSNQLHVEKGLSVDPKTHHENGDGRFHLNVLQHRDNANRTGAIIIDTDIARTSNRMSVIHVHGYGYGQNTVIDFKVCFYPYSGSNGPDGNSGSVIAYSLTDDGNDGKPKFLGINSSGNVAIAIDDYDGAGKYFYNFQVDFYNGTSPVELPTWDVSYSTTDGFGWIQKHILKAPIKQRRTANNVYNSTINGKLGVGVDSPQEEVDITGSLKVRGDGHAATDVLELGQTTDNATAPLYMVSTFDNSGGVLSIGDHLQFKSQRYGQNISFVRNGAGGTVPTALFYNASDTGYMDLYRALNPTADATYQNNVRLHVNGNSFFRGGPLTIGDTAPLTTGGTPRLSLRGAGFNIGNGTNNMSYIRSIATGEFQWQTWNGDNDGELQLQPYGGKVGIGTASPSAKLHVAEGFAYIYQTDSPGKLELRDSRASYDAEISQRSDGRISLATRAGTYGSNGSIEILDSGNVGIGVTDPSTKLEIAGHTRISGVGNTLYFDTTGSEASNFIKTINDYETLIANGRGSAGFGVIGNSNIRLGFGTNYTTAETDLFINYTGNVGIGTSSPDAKLEVTGSTNSDLFSLEGAGSSFKLIGESGDATSINSMAYRLGLRYGSNDNGYIDFYRGPDGATGFLSFGTSGTERMRINSSGLIKVGPNGGDTTNVFEIDTSGSTQHGLMINADQARGAGRYALYVDDEDPNSRGSVVIQTASGPSLTTTGNVGIGDTNPPNKLSVKGSSTDLLYLEGDGITSNSIIQSDTGGSVRTRSAGGAWQLYTGGSANSSSASGATFAIEVDENQNVLIGTTNTGWDGDADNLVVGSGSGNNGMTIYAGSTSFSQINFADSNSGAGRYTGIIRYSHSINAMSFYTNDGTEALRIDSTQDAHFDKDVIAFSTTPSDKRLKTNIKNIDYGLDTIMKLSPKQYDWKKDDRHDIGFIAQEVEEVIPEIVKDKKHFDKEIKTLDYEKLTAVLIKAVQEQQQQINKLEEKLNG